MLDYVYFLDLPIDIDDEEEDTVLDLVYLFI